MAVRELENGPLKLCRWFRARRAAIPSQSQSLKGPAKTPPAHSKRLPSGAAGLQTSAVCLVFLSTSHLAGLLRALSIPCTLEEPSMFLALLVD